VATELLVPNDDFVSRWSSRYDVDTNVAMLARRYRVSEIVILRRALETGTIDELQHEQHYGRRRGRRGGGGGGNYYRTLLVRNSKTFTFSLLAAVAAGRVSYREAATLLNVSMAKVPSLHDLLTVGESGA
jgi:Zn-dependent peptidase ImmA (M78 family)